MRKLFLLVLITTACALAQAPGFFPWWDSPIVRDLNLSEDQRKQIRDTVREYRDRLIEQRAVLQKAEGHLQDAMNEEQVNESKANDAIEKVIAARAELTRTLSQMSLKLRLLLTPQQWRELQRRRPMGRGAPARQPRPGRRMDRRPGQPPRPPDSPEPPPPGLDPEL